MVRAHPTVPAFNSAELPLELNYPLHCRDTFAVACHPPVLENPHPFTHNSAKFCPGGWMTIFRARHFQFGLLATALSVSIGSAAGQTYTPEQEQACTGDAFRLCSAEIPDVGRVTACMVAKKDQLSPPCRAQFRPDPEPREAVARPAGRPTVIRPATPRKAVSAKARKAKKPKKVVT